MNKFVKYFVAVLFTLALITSIHPSFAYAADRDSGNHEGFLTQVVNKVKNVLNTRGVIKGATVSSKGTTSLVISKDGKSYTVSFDASTKFRRKFWGTSTIDEIQIGDSVNVIGKWTDDSHTTIQAIQIRDLSIMKRFGVFFGNVISLTSDGFVMKTVNRGNQTVTITSSSKLIDRTGKVISQSDIKVGDRVRVRGLWDKTNSTVTEVTQVKDFSIPMHVASPSPEAK